MIWVQIRPSENVEYMSNCIKTYSMLDLYYIRYYVIASLAEGNPFNIQHSLNWSIL